MGSQFPTPSDTQLRAIWEEFSAPLRSFITGRVSSPETAADILQEVFLRIHTRLDTVRDLTKLRSWTYQIARNVIIDHYRSHRVVSPLPGDLDVDDPSDEQGALITGLAASLRDMIAGLPAPYARAVLLTDIEGMSQGEYAAREGISLPGAKSRVQRGRRMLKDMLLNCCHFEFDRRGAVLDYHAHCCCCAARSPER